MGPRPRGPPLHQRHLLHHPGAPELPQVGPPRPRLPTVEVEADRLRPPPLRPGLVPQPRCRQVHRLHRRLPRPQPDAVPHVPPLQRGAAPGPVGQQERELQADVLPASPPHHRHLLVALPDQRAFGGQRWAQPHRPMESLPRRGGPRLVLAAPALRLGDHRRRQLVHPALPLLRAPPTRRMPLLPPPQRHRPHPPLLPPRRLPHGPRRHQPPRRLRRIHRQRLRALLFAGALRGRRVEQRGKLPATAALPGQRDAAAAAGPGVLRASVGGVPGRDGGRGRGEDEASGHDGGDAAAAGRTPEPVRALGARRCGDVQRLRALVLAGPHRHVEPATVRNAGTGIQLNTIDAK